MGETFADVAGNGPMLLAIGAAALAGLVSFLSPCVLPLMPGYLSYVTGLAGADLDAALGSGGERTPGGQAAGGVAVLAEPATRRTAGRGRVLAGTSLFVLGFAVVFTLMATLVANIGITLQTHRGTLNIVLGVLIILLGLAFLGLVPGMQREFRIHKLPSAGLVGAPVFGALFGLSWMPCTGPTLGAVLALATTSGQTDRAVVLALAYSLGLGLPFVLFGLFFRKLLGVFRAVRRHSRWVTRVGGALLIVVGLALVTGGWNSFLVWLLTTFNFDAGTLL
jgi:cytochrome c-type biogenesis protein